MIELENITTSVRNKMMSVILFGSFMALLAETLFNNALTGIMHSFDINQSTVQWLSTGYLLVVGLMIPMSSWVFNNFKTKNSYLFMIFTFLIGSLIGWFAPNFSVLLVGRLIQAIAAGLLMPFIQNIILMLFPPEKRGLALGITGLVIALGPTVGPTLSGIILEYFGWRDLFALLATISVIVIILGIFFTKNINTVKKSKLDILSLLMSILGFGGLLYAFSEIGNTGTFNLSVVITGIIGIVSILVFIYRQSHLEKPLININIFKNHVFNLTTLISTLSNIAMVGIELIMPLYLQNTRTVSALETGLVMMPGAILMGIFNPLSGAIYDKIGVRKISIIGFSFILVGTIPMLWFGANSNLIEIICSYSIRMIGVALVMMNSFTDGINSLDSKYTTDGNAASSTIRQVGGSLGTVLSMTFVTLGFNSVITSSGNKVIAFSNGYHFGFILMFVVAILGLLLSFLLPKINKD
ncbi:DHA2 family efflux MFS transporter permease subunit [Apilactobacillus apisilvae]|uniref:DHA2 family efflux MFS transporter permease subunit n=1 Tax=Apilactobacillus apisilvae TaxID=2923364 RepID=A0ABY4PI17_9LACO|nr:MDR family MFS transporter [Apilactobacillus apisilvae]UQS85119.1 DHA2 family efflux MFS transporter permease subunit [Apilactobacillus apisilvae]